MSIAQIADEYGVTRQAVYKRIKADDAKRENRDVMGYRTANLMDTGITEGNAGILIDPETGLAFRNTGNNALVIGRMGDEKVTAFVQYHMEMLRMRQGVDKHNVEELYNRFYNYLGYCAEHGIVPNNMNAYFAIGVSRHDISAWRLGKQGTPEHKEFADAITAFFASIHEQGATDGVLNPISAMFWQKAHDGLIEASKVEVVQEDPLGERRSAADIAAKYTDLPD